MTDELLNERLEKIESQLALLLRVIVVQQKNAAEAVGVSTDTVRNKVNRGEVSVLHKDGSRLNFVTLAAMPDLKVRRPKRK